MTKFTKKIVENSENFLIKKFITQFKRKIKNKGRERFSFVLTGGKSPIKLYKNLILNGCSVIEFFNSKYDPFNFKLSGWSEHMNVEVDNYDDVLEELYEKYRGSGGDMPPELKLLLLILVCFVYF